MPMLYNHPKVWYGIKLLHGFMRSSVVVAMLLVGGLSFISTYSSLYYTAMTIYNAIDSQRILPVTKL